MMSMNRLSCSCILGLSLGMSEAAPGAEYTVGAKATTNLPRCSSSAIRFPWRTRPWYRRHCAAWRTFASAGELHAHRIWTETDQDLARHEQVAVIHFNFGIHDTGTEGITPEVYRENLTQLVGIWKGPAPA